MQLTAASFHVTIPLRDWRWTATLAERKATIRSAPVFTTTKSSPLARAAFRFVMVALLTIPAPSGIGGGELFVSPRGSDTNSGDAAHPLATLTGARDALRRLRSAGEWTGPCTVLVQPGTYVLREPLLLETQDGGTEAAPVEYRAGAGGEVRITGGIVIQGWSPHTQTIYQADVSNAALPPTCRLLVCDGQRQEIARFPNRNPADVNGGDWAYVAGDRLNMYADSPGHDAYYQSHAHLDFWQRNVPELTRTLTVRPEDLRPWSHVEHGEVSIFPRFNWWHYVVPIESMDGESRSLRLAPGCFYEIRPGDRYFVRNVLEELDQPGEWFLDHRAQTVYFWPPTALEQASVQLAAAESLFTLRDCQHITLRGFIWECCNGTAISLENCAHCTLAGGTVRNVGDRNGSGVRVQGGQHCSISGNDIFAVGAYGIELGGGELTSLKLANNVADNNYIHHVGLVGRHAKGIEVTGAGNRVTHNLIHDVPQSGVFMWGAKHLVEFNRIRHTCLEAEDTGAIGGGAIDWLSWQGVVIRHNFISDTIGFGYDAAAGRWRSPYFAWSIYADWAASGVEITGNVLARAPCGLLNLHSGRENLVENNIFVDGDESQLDCRGWTTATGFWSTMVDGWVRKYGAAAGHAAWRAVPSFKDPRAVPLPDTHVMRDNVIRRNIFAYENPTAVLWRYPAVPLEHHQSDFNLVFAGGPSPRTGIHDVSAVIGPNEVPQGGFEDIQNNAVTQIWSVTGKTNENARIRITEEQAHGGRRSLVVEPHEAVRPPNTVRWMQISPPPIAFRPGTLWRFSAWMRVVGPPTTAGMTLFSWKESRHNWSVHQEVPLTPDWTLHTLVARLPAPGDSDYRDSMDRVWIRLSVPATECQYWVDDVTWEEVQAADEWQSWQRRGLDQHSVMGDPLFMDRAGDDFRMKPESPAWRLGLQPIPWDEIGPYASSARASWPIEEAPGVRESVQREIRPPN